jgi:heat shock protein HslJ
MSKIFILITIVILTTSCDKNKIIYVADNMVACEGVSEQKCLQIKENKEDEWTLFYDTIEGFEYKEGFLHKIEVTISKIKNPPSDGSKLKYKLNNIIYQEPSPVKSAQNLLSVKKWKAKSIVGLDSLVISPTIIFDEAANTISGNAGCNNYGTTYIKKDNLLSFGLVISTKMMCTNMNIEKAFMNCLAQCKSYKITDDKLVLYDKTKAELMVCSSLVE